MEYDPKIVQLRLKQSASDIDMSHKNVSEQGTVTQGHISGTRVILAYIVAGQCTDQLWG